MEQLQDQSDQSSLRGNWPDQTSQQDWPSAVPLSNFQENDILEFSLEWENKLFPEGYSNIVNISEDGSVEANKEPQFTKDHEAVVPETIPSEEVLSTYRVKKTKKIQKEKRGRPKKCDNQGDSDCEQQQEQAPKRKRIRKNDKDYPPSKWKNIPKYFFIRLKHFYNEALKNGLLADRIKEQLAEFFKQKSIGFKKIRSILKIEDFRRIVQNKVDNNQFRDCFEELKSKPQLKENILEAIPAMIVIIKDPKHFRSWPGALARALNQGY